MTRALTTAATGMVAQQFNMDTIASNLANVNTTGFKAQRAEFEDVMYQTLKGSGATTGTNSSQPTPMQVGLGSHFSATSTDLTQGALQPTGNPLDISIQGNGYFKVLTPSGEAYTRDGSFKTAADGTLVTSDGYQVQPSLVIPPGSSQVTISSDGTVSAKGPKDTQAQPLSPTIKVYVFANPAGLTRVGQNLYEAGGSSGDPTENSPATNGAGSLQSGFLEGSNVAVVEEMTKMILAQRAYEINSKAIQTSDEMLSTLNQLKR